MNFEITRVRTDLLLYAQDVATLLTLYTHIRIDRAMSGGGPWSPLTDTTAKPASTRCRKDGPYAISGKYLNLTLPDGTLFSHIFTTPDPVSATDAMTELNGASAQLDCVVDGDTLVLRTLDTGTDACLKVDGGDACVNLGVALNDTAFGLAGDVLLVAGQVIYPFTDENGDSDWSYRYRFINAAPPRESEPLFSYPGTELSLDLDLLAVGHAHAVDTDGRAAAGAIAHVGNRYVPPSVSGRLVIGGQSKVIDRHGDVWFPLVRGAQIEFWIAGTPLHRIIEVPDAAEFDMLDPSLVRDDPWGIVVPPYTGLPRTTP